MNVAVYGQRVTKQTAVYFMEFLGVLKDFGWNPVVHSDLKEILVKKIGLSKDTDEFSSYKDLQTGIDLSFSIGGDGTFMKNVKYVRDSGVPVLGINTGRLGFLANVSRDQIQEAMDLVHQKKFVHQKRSMIKIETEDNIFGDNNVALNEVVLQKKDTSSMITVHAELEGKYLNSYWADGLIVATPSGSTAYSLSCGGPIITPGCQVHILTPIAPHNLNVRPMVVPDHMPIKLSVEGRSRRFLASLDGHSMSIRQGEEIFVSKADYMINVIKFEDNNFLDTIRNKMLWGIDKRN
ncbi:MAG: NAD kinase [Crocinitomicaceae bacterium]|nr:NAD kinase [Flavobacteriales bacterium]NQZ37390.1 NAD kinase [Crocinitomicaceae bacterium]PHR34254.1 MAG: NAD kinase [Fluviicola sp.]